MNDLAQNHPDPSEVLAELIACDGAVEVFTKAHAAVLTVAPRAHDDVVRAVAFALVRDGRVQRGTVATILTERDPVAREVRASFSNPARKAVSR